MASMSSIPGKITLQSTSQIPLSDRFKMVQQKALIKKNIGNPQVATAQPTSQGSQKNRLFAAALATKPSVLAALKIKRKSIKQRFRDKTVAPIVRRPFSNLKKPSIVDRLQVSPATNANGRKLRINRNNFVGTVKVTPKNIRRAGRNQGRTDNQYNNNNNNANRKLFNHRMNNYQVNRVKRSFNSRPVNNQGPKRVQQKFKQRTFNAKNNNLQFDSRRGFNQRRKGFNGRNDNNNQRGPVNQGRGNSNQKFRNTKKRFQNRWQQPAQRKNVNRGQLDKDLDTYMNKTKSHLDADLDAYMSGA